MVTVWKPDASLEKSFLNMLDDYEAHDPENGMYYAAARDDFEGYLRGLQAEEMGLHLAPGFVPCSHRWLTNAEGAVVGIARVRHNIETAFLAEEAGHIGYDVPPSHRRRGYGTASLQAGLARAQEIGLDKVLLCADAANIASWRTIERCGGILEQERHSKHYDCLARRYWIELPKFDRG